MTQNSQLITPLALTLHQLSEEVSPMKRQGLLIAVLLLIPAALQAQVIAYDFSALYQSAAPSVVLIASDSGMGSGFLVSPFGHIATNFHVIRNSKYLSVQFPDGR